jgi:hypothetical protein
MGIFLLLAACCLLLVLIFLLLLLFELELRMQIRLADGDFLKTVNVVVMVSGSLVNGSRWFSDFLGLVQ